MRHIDCLFPSPCRTDETPHMGPQGREDEMKALWNQFRSDESGQSLVEYALVIALVALAVIGALVIFKDKIAAVFTRMGNKLDTVG